jgi:hypothetical protein
MSAGSRRNDAAEDRRKRDTTPDLLFKHKKNNSCNIRLKVVETLKKHASETLEKHI